MPYDPLQLKTDVDAITTSPKWNDEKTRRDFIRQIGIDSKSSLDPQAHQELMSTLWGRAEPGMLQKAGEFVGTAVGEVVKSIPAAGGAAVMAASDLLGVTDSGSATRIAQGVESLVDTAGQRIKQLAPNDRQEQRDALLDSLKTDLDSGSIPQGFESWLAGDYDNKEIDDPETKQFVDAVVSSISRAGVASDKMGDIDQKRLMSFMQSDRNPARADSDIPNQAGARQFLADYAATKDPASWEAFKNRVTETDEQYKARLANWRAGQAESAATLETMPEGVMKEMTQRSFSMQESPIDLASAALPFLRGAKALQAAKAGGTAATIAKDVATGAVKEAAQEGVTEALSDPRATAGQIAEAAAMGAVGSSVVEGGMAGAGALMRPNETQAPAEEAVASTVEGETMLPAAENIPAMDEQAQTAVERAIQTTPEPTGDARFAPPTEIIEQPINDAVAAVIQENADILPVTAKILEQQTGEAAPIEQAPQAALPPEDQSVGEGVTLNVAQEQGSIPPDAASFPQTPETSIINENVTTGAIPLMVTRDMRQQLFDLGYSKAEVDAMRPADAQAILQPISPNAGFQPVGEAATQQPQTTPSNATVQGEIPQSNLQEYQTPEIGGAETEPSGSNRPVESGQVQAEIQAQEVAQNDTTLGEPTVKDSLTVEPTTEESSVVEPPASPLPTTVSIANDPLNKLAAQLGNPVLETPLDGPYTYPEAWAKATTTAAQNPQAGSLLVKRINERGGDITPDEMTLLLHEQAIRQISTNNAIQNLLNATPEQKEDAQKQYADAILAQAELQQASALAGTQAGRNLNFRRMQLRLDYSTAQMALNLEGALQRRLTPDELAEVDQASKAILANEKDIEIHKNSADSIAQQEAIFDEILKEVQAEKKAAARDLVAQSRAAAKQGKSLVDFLTEKREEARKRIRSRGGNLNVGINPADLFDRAIIVASYIAEGIRDTAEITKRLVQEFGEAVRKHIPQILKEAETLHQIEQEVFTAPEQKTPKSVMEEVKAANAITPAQVVRMAKEKAKAGMTKVDEVMKSITADIQAVLPSITEREIRDMFSGYGQVKYPSQEMAEKQVREWKALARYMSAIEDAQAKKAPKKTGLQRDEQTAEVRAAHKELRRVMKESGIERAPGPNALKTALDAVKTRLRNRIEDLQKQIQAGKRVKEPRKGVEYDQEAKTLEAERDRLQASLDELDKPLPPTPQERVQARLKNLDGQIEDLRRRIAEKNFAPAAEKTPLTEQIQVKLDERDALKQELDALQIELEGETELSQEQINELAVQHYERQIREVERQIKEEDFTRPENPKAEDTPEITRLKMRLEALREQRDDLKEAKLGKKEKTLSERIDIAAEALERSIDKMNEQIQTGDIGVKGRASRDLDVARIKNLRAERDSMRQVIQQMRKAKADAAKDPELERIKADSKYLDRMIKMYEDKIKKGNFKPRPKKLREYDRSLAQKVAKADKAKADWNRKVFEARLAERSKWSKSVDFAVQSYNLARAFLLSADFGGIMRQGLFAIGHPVTVAKSLPSMFKSAMSQQEAYTQKALLEQRANFPLYKKSGLFISDLDTDSLNYQEEQFYSRFALKTDIPESDKRTLKGVVVRAKNIATALPRASQRSHTTYLNNLRVQLFDALLSNLQKGPQPTQQELEAIAKYVNVCTGRGEVGKGPIALGMNFLNQIFLAPRWVVSRFQLIYGYPFINGTARTRKLVAEEYARFAMGLGIIYAMAIAAQDEDDPELELDPRSTDFMKVRYNDTRLDMTGGIGSAFVFISRVISGETKNKKGQILPLRQSFRLANLWREVPRTDKPGFAAQDAEGVLKTFIRSKLSPLIAASIDMYTGKDIMGQPVTPSDVALRSVIPISAGDIEETMKSHDFPKAIGLTTMALIGNGVMTYKKPTATWSEKLEEWFGIETVNP